MGKILAGSVVAKVIAARKWRMEEQIEKSRSILDFIVFTFHRQPRSTSRDRGQDHKRVGSNFDETNTNLFGIRGPIR